MPLESVQSSSSSPPHSEPCEAIIDPPPPYPSRGRRHRTVRSSRHSTQQHAQLLSSTESYSDQEAQSSPQTLLIHGSFSEEHDETGATEATPFFSNGSGGSGSSRGAVRRVVVRPRSLSHASTTSAAPSLAQTVFSLFRIEDQGDLNDWLEARQLLASDEQNLDAYLVDVSRRQWATYFQPLSQEVYYKSLFHLVVVNFPYALTAWVYLFVFTVAGTTLLMALPLGAILCFSNLLGARAFARGELALQTRFHSPLSYPDPCPPRPIFTRLREATSAEVEAGYAAAGDLVPERSFYRNAYAMFTDPTSYQALFYFLVIKPSITLVFSLVLIVFILPSLLLVFPAPAALRAVRRLGIWQANVAVEGLYLAVR